jgi:hypothetical protein
MSRIGNARRWLTSAQLTRISSMAVLAVSLVLLGACCIHPRPDHPGLEPPTIAAPTPAAETPPPVERVVPEPQAETVEARPPLAATPTRRNEPTRNTEQEHDDRGPETPRNRAG